MAEGVLFDTATNIIKSLGPLIRQEIGLLWGFKDEVQKIRNTVSTIQAELLDAEEQQDNNHAVKDWLEKLKDVMYDVDDLLDDYSTKLLRQQVMTRDKKMAKQVCIFFSNSNQLVYGLKMGHRIKAVRTRLDDIAANRSKFSFTKRHLEHKRREDTHSFVPDQEVIGREADKKAIKDQLLLDSNVKGNISIIPIVGIGGLGKTTLAQHVFNDDEVKRHFDLMIWVCISDPFDVKAIVQKIIECATGIRPESLEMDLLQRQLREKIDGKRYLLVLDDVWNEDRDTWLRLETLLLGGLRGSKVLITTRSIKVANITSAMSPYLLEGLSESNSWNLFKRMAFKDEEELKNPKLVEIGREIIQKCAQVPLAIRSIASLLYFDNSEAYWLSFKNNALYKITQQERGIFPILKLSYDHLPPHLKQCFAFCSLFPKDSKIKVEVLIQLWIAQGFIHSSNLNKCLEDVGREYFKDLLWRSFFQDINTNKFGDICECKMHDLIHDLAQSVAGVESIISTPDAKNVVERTRHVAFDSLNSLRDIPAPLLKADRMRSFLLRPPGDEYFGSRVLEGNKQVYDTLISGFKCLRALTLIKSNIEEVPNFIGKLKHLRFLNLSWNKDIKLLPTSMTKLQNLQTLRLDFCSGLEELPEDTRNLISLRHLTLCGCDNLTHMPHGLGKLTALQTLTMYNLGRRESSVPKQKGGLHELGGLNELGRNLCITGLEHLRSSLSEAEAANLKTKQHLRILKLKWDPEAGDDSGMAIANDEQLLENLRPCQNLEYFEINGYAGVRLSSWLSSLSKLVDITIGNCKWCQHIPPLDRFPSLDRLSLENLIALEYIINDDSDVSSFPLTYLRLKNLPKLKGWWRMRETVTAEHERHHRLPLFPLFPCLSFLLIENCPMNMMSLIPVVTPGRQTTPSTSSLFSHLSKLKTLVLKRLEELEYLPEEWLQKLTSLKTVNISQCRKLRVKLSPLFQQLTALEYLWIDDITELISNEDDEGAQCLGPTALRKLYILNVRSLVSLPTAIRHFTTLRDLSIGDCPSLMSLPEGIGDLNSLEMLSFVNCPSLISLPEGMHPGADLQLVLGGRMSPQNLSKFS
ncbi:disease resistance protein RGA2-like [Corylus avellana]|uniref:disease resistance protein RGA2-like n=1 Tax=Corylus avellana TaxID=13451 RepID=UPI00286D53D6|nr:disease resistance protein RGA2-like [Corylus avellana]XP_059452216.1 disease resistance protein RGA2-like [Corylus avellana]XP_059452217.1 disease resistance protein RGA2-like [Corylus avellana]XP_059452218.1 disease resistance protein RGA2-like [Corylus avellana]XP_059452219.1 disease resistance protein RGA2-like [Corylus avellana]XP_059452220.1 disease resistance protein RGA2-like [Corylus avellana]